MKAVLFDLDGTLLDLDVDQFMPHYLRALGKHFESFLPPDQFVPALMAGTSAMIRNDGRTSNEEVFWTVFEEKTGIDRGRCFPLVERFYRDDFSGLSVVSRPVAAAAHVVQAVKASGAILVLATNAIFPEVAIVERLRWAKVDPEAFDLITTYENMHASKPNPTYFLEICQRVGVAPQEAVMIGNDPELDVRPAQAVGLRTYLVDDVTPAGATEQEFAKSGPEGALKEPVIPDGRGPLADVLSFLGIEQAGLDPGRADRVKE